MKPITLFDSDVIELLRRMLHANRRHSLPVICLTSEKLYSGIHKKLELNELQKMELTLTQIKP